MSTGEETPKRKRTRGSSKGGERASRARIANRAKRKRGKLDSPGAGAGQIDQKARDLGARESGTRDEKDPVRIDLSEPAPGQ